MRKLVSSGSPYESKIGFSRAVRVGNVIHVAGTTATDEQGNVVGAGDPYAQATQALHNIERALIQAGASIVDVGDPILFELIHSGAELRARLHGNRSTRRKERAIRRE